MELFSIRIQRTFQLVSTVYESIGTGSFSGTYNPKLAFTYFFIVVWFTQYSSLRNQFRESDTLYFTVHFHNQKLFSFISAGPGIEPG